MNVKIKKTAKHSAGSKYLQIAKNGPIAAPVEIKANPAGKLEAFIDDEAIGFLKIDAEELPEVYEIQIMGIDPEDPNLFVAEMKAAKTKNVSSGSGPQPEDDEVARIASEGIMEEDEVRERIAVMKDNSVAKSVLLMALSKYRKYKALLHKPSAIYQNMRDPKKESILNQALIAALTRAALIFAGEKSTGKNICAETIAYVLGRPFYRLNFQKDMLLEDIFGSKTTDNSASDQLELDLAKAKIKVELAAEQASQEDFDKAAMFELLKAQCASIRLVQSTSAIIDWAKNGGVLLLDELNMAAPNILQAVVNSAADAEKVLIVPGVATIKLNPDCVLIGGMNPGYAGTFELNKATKSRCGMILFDYPDNIKPQLKANFSPDTCLKEKQFNICNDLYKDFVIAVQHGRVSNDCLNIRGFVNALAAVEMFPDATTLANQIEIFVINACDEDDRGVLAPMLRDKVAI